MSKDNEQSKLSYSVAARTMRRSLGLSWQMSKSKVALFIFGAFLEIGGTLLATFAGARVVGILIRAVSDHSIRSQAWNWLALTVAGWLAINVGFWLMTYVKRVFYIMGSRWGTVQFASKLCQINIQDFQNAKKRNRINKLDNGYSWQISNQIVNALDLTYGIVRAGVIVLVASQVAWWVVPVLVLFLIPSVVAESRTAKSSWFVWDQKGDERHVFWGIMNLMSRAKGQFEIRAFQAKKSLITILDNMLGEFQLKQLRILQKANRAIGTAKVSEIIGVALVEVWLIVRVLYKYDLSISSYIFYSGIVSRINGALNSVAGVYVGGQEALLYASDFYNFLDEDIGQASDVGAMVTDKGAIPKIEFKVVSFKYPGSKRYVFKDLNLKIQAGEHIAIIGENGAGKTTLIKLLMRFYKVTTGSIEINGVNINDLSLDDWYGHLGTLFQQFNEYPLDIQDNVTISGRGDFDEPKMRSAINDAGLDEVVAKLPYGLETVLDASFKKGSEPSGGQWQRVALARAFYRDADILILDEPTSAIDAKAEYDIFNSIFKNQAAKTTIIISHRFSTVRRASRIIVVDQGKIIQQGTHHQLIKQEKGLYKEMFDKQAEGYR